MTVSLLGPVSVTTDGTPRAVAGTKLQSLLALLALAVPHTVSDDRLLEELWGDEQPAKPANALQALVSTLRRLLGRDVVARHGSGYALQLEPDAVDTIRFEHLVESARGQSARSDHAAAAERYRAALALVRGEPLAELVDHWFARDASSRLGELIVDRPGGARSTPSWPSGRHAEVLPHVLELIGRHPLRERLRAQLILALYRSGRQADALQAYREARAHLRDELGLDPGPELQALERSVLAHDPALAAPIAVASPVATRAALPTAADVLRRAPGRARRRRRGAGVGAARHRSSDRAASASRAWRWRSPVSWTPTREVWLVELAPVVDALAVADAVASGLGAPERSAPDGTVAPSPRRSAPSIAWASDRWSSSSTTASTWPTAAAEIVLELLARLPEPAHPGHQPGAARTRRRARGRRRPARRRRRRRPLRRARPRRPAAVRHRHRRRRHRLARAPPRRPPAGDRARRGADARRSRSARSRAASTTASPSCASPATARRPATTGSRRRSTGATTCCSRTSSARSGGSPCSPAAPPATPSSGSAAPAPSSWRPASSTARCSPRTPRARVARFGMLESLRAYGLARLGDEGELDAARADHLAWCIDLAAEAAGHVRTADQLAWLARLDDEHDNLRAALGYAVGHDPEGALRLIGPLILPWWFRGRRQEIVDWADAALAASTPPADAGRGRGARAVPAWWPSPACGVGPDGTEPAGAARARRRRASARRSPSTRARRRAGGRR